MLQCLNALSECTINNAFVDRKLIQTEEETKTYHKTVVDVNDRLSMADYVVHAIFLSPTFASIEHRVGHFFLFLSLPLFMRSNYMTLTTMKSYAIQSINLCNMLQWIPFISTKCYSIFPHLLYINWLITRFGLKLTWLSVVQWYLWRIKIPQIIVLLSHSVINWGFYETHYVYDFGDFAVCFELLSTT